MNFGGEEDQPSGPLERYFQSGLEMYNAGNFAQAEVQFERALQLNRRHNESLKYLGLAQFNQGKWHLAIQKLGLYLDADPSSEEILISSGECCIQLGRYYDAERFYRKAISVNQNNAEAYLGLGQVIYRRGVYNEAINVLKKGAQIDPDNTGIMFMLGEAYNNLDKTDMAIECFEKVLSLRQDNSRVYYNLGILYDKKSMPEKASAMYRRARELSEPQRTPAPTPVVSQPGEGTFFSRSLTLVESGEEESKIPSLDKARYNKMRRRQAGKKPHKVIERPDVEVDRAGTMDLTKASLKINEALRIIKDSKKS
jgi:tetratricopeptide (TPR) repeat protein